MSAQEMKHRRAKANAERVGGLTWWPAKGATHDALLTEAERADVLEGRWVPFYTIEDEPEHAARVVSQRDFAEAYREEMQAFVLGLPSRAIRVDPRL